MSIDRVEVKLIDSKNLGPQGSPKPANYWIRPEAQDEMRREGMTFYREYNSISSNTVGGAGRWDLVNAVRRYYPGKWTQFRKDIALPASRRERNTWSKNEALAEARHFVEQHGSLTQQSLHDHDRDDLQGAISRYAGGITAAKKELGFTERRK